MKKGNKSTLSATEKNQSTLSAGGTSGAQSSSSLMPQSSSEPESMKKLRALKEKIQGELQQEQKERVDFESREPVIPLSLAADYANPSKRSVKATKQQVEKLVALTKEKVGQNKQLDKHLQKDLEVELEKKAGEMVQLKSHNQRLRDIITLRQESNTRREEKFESEVSRLKEFTDDVCLDAKNYHATMQHLRDMNLQVQQDAVLMKEHIEKQAEAERLALIRTYRVRMREVKQQLKLQESANLEGASAWIKRYNILDADRQLAATNLKSLQQKIELLTTDNRELRVMRKHQEEQRNALAQKIAVLRRENKRFEDHIAKLEIQQRASPSASADTGTTPGSAAGTPVRLAQSRGGGRITPQDPNAKKQTQALNRVRNMLEEMRNSLQKVRTAHVELLQERTELEMFVRQCIEDVRREMFRFTVVNNISRTMNTAENRWEDQTLLQEYGVKERKRLLDILASKMEVLTLLLDKTFPGKLIKGDEPLGEFLRAHQHTWELQSEGSQEQQKVPVVHEMDELWNRWKEWTRSVTPS